MTHSTRILSVVIASDSEAMTVGTVSI